MSSTDPGQHLFWLSSRAFGVVAMVLVSLSVGVGLALAGRISKRPGMARRLKQLHESLALAGLLAIALHGLLLLGDSYLRPGLAGIAIWAGIVDLMISTLALVVAASFVVDAVVGLALAQLVARGWAQSRWQELFLLVVGALIVVAATSLPEIGGIVKLCVIVLGLGAMTVAGAEAWQRRHPPAAPSWGAQVAAPTPPTPAAPG